MTESHHAIDLADISFKPSRLRALRPEVRGTPISPPRKKVSHGDVAKLRYLFSYLAGAFDASPAQGGNNHMCARHKMSVDNDFQDTSRYSVERYSNKRTRNYGMEQTEWP